jgi:hypothetical protein
MTTKTALKQKIAGAAIALALLFAARAGRADSIGFMLQPGLGFGTSIVPAPDVTAMPTAPAAGPSTSFTLIPMLRIGVAFRPVAFAFEISYSAGGIIFDTAGDTTSSVIRLGLVGEPIFWRSADHRVRLYALLGVNTLTLGQARVSPSWGAGFSLGFGGTYSVHPNFAVGLELGARPEFVPETGAMFISSEVYVALTGTFVTGHHELGPKAP